MGSPSTYSNLSEPARIEPSAYTLEWVGFTAELYQQLQHHQQEGEEEEKQGGGTAQGDIYRDKHEEAYADTLRNALERRELENVQQ